MTRRVTFVSLVFHPDTSATSQLFTDLFERMAGGDWQISVLCGFPAKQVRAPASGLPRHECFHGIPIDRCGIRLEGKRNLATRAVGYGSFLTHVGWRLLRDRHRGMVLCGTDPPFGPAVIGLLARLGRFPYRLMLLDLYPDGLIELGTLSERSPLAQVWRYLNRRSFREAKNIVVIGRDMGARVISRYGANPARVVYIPHWGTAEAESRPGSRDALLGSLGLREKFVVQYSGNMGLWHDMDALVRAAERLQENGRIHFLFIGNGRRRARAEALSRSLALENITWIDFLPREQLPTSLAACDLALISLREGLSGVAVPSKLYGIMAAARPVVAAVPADSEVALTVEESKCGLAVPPGDAEAIAAAIRRLAEHPDLAGRMGRSAREAYLAKYTIGHAVEAFERLWSNPP